MTIKELAYEIEDLNRTVKNVSSLQLALCIAIYEGSADVKEYEGAFAAFTDLCVLMEKKANDLETKAFDSFGKGEKSSERCKNF